MIPLVRTPVVTECIVVEVGLILLRAVVRFLGEASPKRPFTDLVHRIITMLTAVPVASVLRVAYQTNNKRLDK